jgi:hypothetical protein
MASGQVQHQQQVAATCHQMNAVALVYRLAGISIHLVSCVGQLTCAATVAAVPAAFLMVINVVVIVIKLLSG